AAEQLFARDGVVPERGTGEEEAILRQAAGIERRHRPAGLTEQRQRRAQAAAIEALVERRAADGVIDGVTSLPARLRHHDRFEIILRVIDDDVASSLARDV